MNIAIILTVYNRKDITIKSLKSLQKAINKDNNSYYIYMTNDGCTDGTEKAVQENFPNIKIIETTGNLCWSQGMNIAWKEARKDKDYDFYIWFNDDAILYENALSILFKPLTNNKLPIVVSGAFIDNNKNVSYGGRSSTNQLLVPNGNFQKIFYMNGNLVLIPKYVFDKLGYIDPYFIHGLGDWDYGLRALKMGFNVLLTSEYVGITDRHDIDTKPYFNKKYNFIKRFNFLYSPKYSVKSTFYFHKRHFGSFIAVRRFIKDNIFTLFPILYHYSKHN